MLMLVASVISMDVPSTPKSFGHDVPDESKHSIDMHKQHDPSMHKPQEPPKIPDGKNIKPPQDIGGKSHS